MISSAFVQKLTSIVFFKEMAYLWVVKPQLKYSILCLIIAVCASLGGPTQLQAANKVGYLTDARNLPPPPSQQFWTQGNDIPSPTKTYHSPEVVLSSGNPYPHRQDFFVAYVGISASPLSHLTYFRSRPRDPPTL